LPASKLSYLMANYIDGRDDDDGTGGVGVVVIVVAAAAATAVAVGRFFVLGR